MAETDFDRLSRAFANQRIDQIPSNFISENNVGLAAFMQLGSILRPPGHYADMREHLIAISRWAGPQFSAQNPGFVTALADMQARDPLNAPDPFQVVGSAAAMQQAIQQRTQIEEYDRSLQVGLWKDLSQETQSALVTVGYTPPSDEEVRQLVAEEIKQSKPTGFMGFLDKTLGSTARFFERGARTLSYAINVGGGLSAAWDATQGDRWLPWLGEAWTENPDFPTELRDVALAFAQGYTETEVLNFFGLEATQRTREHPEFDKVMTSLNAKKMSVGRGVAHAAGLDPESGAHAKVSGALDMVDNLALDPLLFAGKGYQAVRGARMIVRHADDWARVSQLGRVQRGIKMLVKAGDGVGVDEGIGRVLRLQPNLAPFEGELRQLMTAGKWTQEGVDDFLKRKIASVADLRQNAGPLIPNAKNPLTGFGTRRVGYFPSAPSAGVLAPVAAKVKFRTGDFLLSASKALGRNPVTRGVGVFLRKLRTLGLKAPAQTIKLSNPERTANTLRNFLSLTLPRHEVDEVVGRFMGSNLTAKETLLRTHLDDVFAQLGVDDVAKKQFQDAFDDQVRLWRDPAGQTVSEIVDPVTRQSIAVPMFPGSPEITFKLPNLQELARASFGTLRYSWFGLGKTAPGRAFFGASSALHDKLVSRFMLPLMLISPGYILRNGGEEVWGEVMREGFMNVLRGRIAFSGTTRALKQGARKPWRDAVAKVADPETGAPVLFREVAEELDIDSVLHLLGNASIDPANVRTLATSIARDGFTEPLVVVLDPRTNEFLLLNHHRLVAAKMLGMDRVPVTIQVRPITASLAEHRGVELIKFRAAAKAPDELMPDIQDLRLLPEDEQLAIMREGRSIFDSDVFLGFHDKRKAYAARRAMMIGIKPSELRAIPNLPRGLEGAPGVALVPTSELRKVVPYGHLDTEDELRAWFDSMDDPLVEGHREALRAREPGVAIINEDGQLFHLADGNHRLAMAMIDGEDMVAVRIAPRDPVTARAAGLKVEKFTPAGRMEEFDVFTDALALGPHVELGAAQVMRDRLIRHAIRALTPQGVRKVFRGALKMDEFYEAAERSMRLYGIGNINPSLSTNTRASAFESTATAADSVRRGIRRKRADVIPTADFEDFKATNPFAIDAWQEQIQEALDGDGLKIVQAALSAKNPQAATAKIAALLQEDDALKRWLNESGVSGMEAVPQTAERLQRAVWGLTHDGQGRRIQAVASAMKKGEVPRGEVLGAIDPARRPILLSGHGTIAVGKDPLSTLITLGFGYMNDGINYIARQPMYMVQMVKAQRELRGWRTQMLERGIADTDQIFDELVDSLAMKRTIEMIDDPEVRSIFSVMHRGIFPFLHAQERFLRRWATTIYRNPAVLRRHQLTLQGFREVGFIYTDDQGEERFIFPGAGLASAAVQEVSRLVWGKDIHIPVTTTGAVKFVAAGINDPFRPSVNPLLSLGLNQAQRHWRTLGGPADFVLGDFSRPDKALWETFAPGVIRKFMRAFNPEDMAGFNSFQIAAIQQLAADGKIPGPESSALEKEKFIQEVSGRARVLFILNGVFSIAGPTSSRVEVIDKMHPVLRSNMKRMPMEEAVASFLRQFPKADLHTIFSTELAEGSVSPLPATQQSALWFDEHEEFVKKYGPAATWFLPLQGGGDAEFSMDAWADMLNLGLRRRRTPKEFLEEGYYRRAADIYYRARDKYEAHLEMIPEWDTEVRRLLRQEWKTWADSFSASNPIFHERFASGQQQVAQRQNVLNQLRIALHDPTAPKMPHLGPLRELVEAYDTIKAQLNALSGRYDESSRETRSQLRRAFVDYAKSLGPVAASAYRVLLSAEFRSVEEEN